MKNIIFLNFDIFNKEKTRFFNKVDKEINKKNYQLITLSSQKILNSKFQCQIMDFENYYIKDNLKLIKSKINISKVTQENWLKVLRLYYQNKSDVFIMNKINYIIYYLRSTILLEQLCGQNFTLFVKYLFISVSFTKLNIWLQREVC